MTEDVAEVLEMFLVFFLLLLWGNLTEEDRNLLTEIIDLLLSTFYDHSYWMDLMFSFLSFWH